MSLYAADKTEFKQQQWLIRGCVQGVGFRPFVYRTAVHCGIAGKVWNDEIGVRIVLQGKPEQFEQFKRLFSEHLPAAATIDNIDIRVNENINSPSRANRPTHSSFKIVSNTAALLNHKNRESGQICPDLALCHNCLGDMLNPVNRRYRYPFINCTECGPRFTIIDRLP